MTHNKPFYAVVIGRVVNFMARPAKTHQKQYREPVLVAKKKYRTKADAETAANFWEGILS